MSRKPRLKMSIAQAVTTLINHADCCCSLCEIAENAVKRSPKEVAELMPLIKSKIKFVTLRSQDRSI